MDHAHQVHAIQESNVEEDMGLGGEAALRMSTLQRLLRDKGEVVVQAAEVSISS